jgi:hypothetical protein
MTELPWDRAKKKTRSQKQEARLGKRRNSKPQINSGRTTWTSKRDVQLYNLLLIEARTTEGNSIKVLESEWKDIRRDAMQTPPGMLPAMHLEFPKTRLLVLDDQDAEEFFNEFEFLRERVKILEGPKISSDD